jgi:hypothetical protein
MPVPVDSKVYHQAGIEISLGLLCTALRFRLTLGQSPKGGCILSPTSDIASATLPAESRHAKCTKKVDADPQHFVKEC